MKLSAAIAAAALAALFATSASAAVTVLGDTSAQECAQDAFHGVSDASAVQTCTIALQGHFIDRRDEAGTYVNRGILQMARMDYDAARSDFDAAIKVDPTLGESWVDRGAINIIEKRFQAGIDDIDKGLTLGIGEPEKAYYNRGVAYEGIDNEKAAYLDYQQAATLKPDWDLPKRELLRFTVTRK